MHVSIISQHHRIMHFSRIKRYRILLKCMATISRDANWLAKKNMKMSLQLGSKLPGNPTLSKSPSLYQIIHTIFYFLIFSRVERAYKATARQLLNISIYTKKCQAILHIHDTSISIDSDALVIVLPSVT